MTKMKKVRFKCFLAMLGFTAPTIYIWCRAALDSFSAERIIQVVLVSFLFVVYLANAILGVQVGITGPGVQNGITGDEARADKDASDITQRKTTG